MQISTYVKNLSQKKQEIIRNNQEKLRKVKGFIGEFVKKDNDFCPQKQYFSPPELKIFPLKDSHSQIKFVPKNRVFNRGIPHFYHFRAQNMLFFVYLTNNYAK